MSELTDKIVAGKREARKRLASLPFAEKLKMVEKMRERERLIASSSLRRQQKRPSPYAKDFSDSHG